MKKKSRMGRPPVPDDERREIRFQVRLSPVELALIERASDGRPSTWARDVLLRAASRRVKGR